MTLTRLGPTNVIAFRWSIPSFFGGDRATLFIPLVAHGGGWVVVYPMGLSRATPKGWSRQITPICCFFSSLRCVENWEKNKKSGLALADRLAHSDWSRGMSPVRLTPAHRRVYEGIRRMTYQEFSSEKKRMFAMTAITQFVSTDNSAHQHQHHTQNHTQNHTESHKISIPVLSKKCLVFNDHFP